MLLNFLFDNVCRRVLYITAVFLMPTYDTEKKKKEML
jgi:hypothetical protein